MSLSSPWSLEVVRHLSGLGVTVHVVEFQPKGKEPGYMDYGRRDHSSESEWLRLHAASVHRVPTGGSPFGRFVGSARALRRIAEECNADIVLTLYGGSLSAAAYLSGFRPYVVYVVGSDVLLATSLQKIVARGALGSAAIVLANGVHLARRAQAMAPRARVEPLYLGVNTAEYTPARKGPNDLSFVCTRGFLEVYDNATIVRALSLLGEMPPGLTTTFLSSGPLLAQTEQLANDIMSPASRDKVIFLGGASHDKLRALVRSASFYLSASLSDGTSSSLLEAMACGLIPIVSDIPANREWIVHEKNGLLFPPGDHRDLADQLRRAISQETWMADARIANRRLVEERADANVNMRTLSKILMTHRRRIATPAAERAS